eukprot:tig00000178_g12725.t1
MEKAEERRGRKLCGCYCAPHGDVYLWTSFALLFVAFVLQPIALGTRGWSTSSMKYCAGNYCGAPTYVRFKVGLFAVAVEDNPSIAPLASGTYQFKDCSAFSVDEYVSGRWGCSELQKSGAAAFALGLVSLVLDLALLFLAWRELARPEASREREHGAVPARAALSAAAGFSAVLQFISFVVWRANAHEKLAPFLSWWATLTKTDEWVYFPGYSHSLAVTAFVLLVASSAGFGFSACNVRGTARESRRGRAYRKANTTPPPPPASLDGPLPPLNGSSPGVPPHFANLPVPPAPAGAPQASWEPVFQAPQRPYEASRVPPRTPEPVPSEPWAIRFLLDLLHTANFFIFISVLFTPLALGTRLWTREYLNYVGVQATGSGTVFAQKDSFLGFGLFAMVVDGNPNTFPLRDGTYSYANCNGNSIYEYSSATPTWGCREVYQAGAATFAMCLIGTPRRAAPRRPATRCPRPPINAPRPLLIYAALFLVILIFTGCSANRALFRAPPAVPRTACRAADRPSARRAAPRRRAAQGAKGTRWYSHTGSMAAVLWLLPIAIIFQLIGVLVWLGKGNAAAKDFGSWWATTAFGPLGVLHTLSSSYALACASLASAGLAWILFLGCYISMRKGTRQNMAPAFDGLPAAPPIDHVVASHPTAGTEYGIGPETKVGARIPAAPVPPAVAGYNPVPVQYPPPYSPPAPGAPAAPQPTYPSPWSPSAPPATTANVFNASAGLPEPAYPPQQSFDNYGAPPPPAGGYAYGPPPPGPF